MTAKTTAAATAAESAESTELALQESKALALAADLGFMDASDFDGAGMEGADKDSFAIPFIQILQKMSPKVDEDSAEYIPGAKAGMLYNTVTGELFDGKKGLHIIPCYYKRTYILWGGREGDGGYKGEFTVEEVEALKLDPTKLVTIDGRMYVPNEDGSVNEKKNDYYADTRSHFVLTVNPETGEFGTAILGLASTQIKSSKKLMTALSQKKVKLGDTMKTPPTFANMVKVTTTGMQNEKGSWSAINFELDGMVTNRAHFDAAKEFYKIVHSGEAKADYAKADTPAAGDVGEPQEAGSF